MATRIDAIFEHGVFRPTQPVEIAEGVRVQLVVVSSEDLRAAVLPANILAEIAALPLESTDDEVTARNHDQFLYGSQQP